MTVYIVVDEYWDDTTIEGVYASLDGAKASCPALEWVRCGDGLEVAGLPYGHRIVIESYEVAP